MLRHGQYLRMKHESKGLESNVLEITNNSAGSENLNAPEILDQSVILNKKLWLERLQTGSQNLLHARHMKPICETIGKVVRLQMKSS